MEGGVKVAEICRFSCCKRVHAVSVIVSLQWIEFGLDSGDHAEFGVRGVKRVSRLICGGHTCRKCDQVRMLPHPGKLWEF